MSQCPLKAKNNKSKSFKPKLDLEAGRFCAHQKTNICLDKTSNSLVSLQGLIITNYEILPGAHDLTLCSYWDLVYTGHLQPSSSQQLVIR